MRRAIAAARARLPGLAAVPGAAVPAALAMALVAAPPAASGAWPREKGAWFLSSSATLWWSPLGRLDGRSKAYLDYGLGHGWGLTLESTRPYAGGHEEVVTLSHPVPWPTGNAAMSWGMGVGRRQVPGAPAQLYLRPVLAWGRGFSAGRLLPWPGWVSAEASAEVRWRARQVAGKLDLTLGLKPAAGWQMSVQARLSAYPGAPWQARLVPAVARDLGAHMKLEIAPGFTLRGPGPPRDLEVALWTQF